MNIYQSVLNSDKYLEITNKIENIRFVSDGEWDWEHGLGHFKRVANYIKLILTDLGADERTIDLGMTAGLLHDIGLATGTKEDHAKEGSKKVVDYLFNMNITEEEIRVIEQSICDHSNGDNIKSLIGMALLLADKLDVTYHRVENSSIHDKRNAEFQKVKRVDVKLTTNKLIVNYITKGTFDIKLLYSWDKLINIPLKVAKYLNKQYIFMINGKIIDL